MESAGCIYTESERTAEFLAVGYVCGTGTILSKAAAPVSVVFGTVAGARGEGVEKRLRIVRSSKTATQLLADQTITRDIGSVACRGFGARVPKLEAVPSKL